MSYKNRITIIIIGICAFALFVSGTLAYFTSSATTTTQNIVSATVEIDITEAMLVDGEWVDFPADGFENVMPSQTVSKKVEIKNVGGTDAWIRVKAESVFRIGENELSPTITVGGKTEDCILITPDTAKWEYKDGYYYYNAALADGETIVFMESATFNKALPNEYAAAVADLIIRAEAVQSNYNGESALTAKGWPETNTENQ